MEVFFKINKITKVFPGVKALDDVSFELSEGEIFAIAGENGAGKSTLIKVMSGVYQPDDGTMEMNGEKVVFSTPQKAFDTGICVVHQELNYIPYLTVAENIMMLKYPVTKFGFVDWRHMHFEAKKALDKIGLSIDTYKTMFECSTAQKQQVEIAKAIYWNARIVILDEPTSALNIEETKNLLKYLLEVKKQGVTIIYITHKLDEIFMIADRVAVLRDGRHIKTLNVAETTDKELITCMVGREIKDMYPKSDCDIGEVVLETQKLSNDDCKDIDLKLFKGEILGIYGLMGAGHIELGQMLFADRPATSGKVFIDGKETKIRNPIDAVRHGFAYVPSERKTEGLILMHSVEKNIASVHYQAFKSRFVNEKSDAEVAEHWIKSLRIKTPTRQTIINSLSGGNQQKVVLAKWLDVSPRIFIMVDPTRGIDVGSKTEIYQLMDELCQTGASIIMITSEMPELLAMSDRAIIMHKGRISGELNRSEFSQEAIISAAIGR